MTKRCRFNKCRIDRNCFFCNNKSAGILIYKNNDEVPSCFSCAKREGKVKRLIKQESIKKSEISLINSENLGILGGDSNE